MGVVSASIALLGRIRKPIFFTIDLYYGILLRTQFSIETWVQGDVRPAPQASPEEVQGLGFRVQGLGFGVEFSLRVRCRPLHALVGVSA